MGGGTFRNNDVMLAANLTYSDRIISRIELSSVDDDVDLGCDILFDRNGSSISLTESCSIAQGTGMSGIIRVDPFISEVLPGSDAEFRCTANEDSNILSKLSVEVV